MMPCLDEREVLLVPETIVRELALMFGAVRIARLDDPDRRDVIADHLALAMNVLIGYQEAEERSIWPLLVERAQGQGREAVRLVKPWHESLLHRSAVVRAMALSWSRDDAESRRNALADTLDDLLLFVRDYLALRKSRIDPLMAAHVADHEWHELLPTSLMESNPPYALTILGMILYGEEPDLIASIVNRMPARVRPDLRRKADEAYAVRAFTVYGTADPVRR